MALRRRKEAKTANGGLERFGTTNIKFVVVDEEGKLRELLGEADPPFFFKPVKREQVSARSLACHCGPLDLPADNVAASALYCALKLMASATRWTQQSWLPSSRSRFQDRC